MAKNNNQSNIFGILSIVVFTNYRLHISFILQFNLNYYVFTILR